MVTRFVRESDYNPATVQCQVLKILSRNQILTSVKSHYTVTNKQNMEGSNPNLALVNINVITKFGIILSIPSCEIERK